MRLASQSRGRAEVSSLQPMPAGRSTAMPRLSACLDSTPSGRGNTPRWKRSRRLMRDRKASALAVVPLSSPSRAADGSHAIADHVHGARAESPGGRG